MEPTLGGFIGFITNVMGISATYLPSDSPIISYVFNFALNYVNQALQAIPNANTGMWSPYAMEVYNLAGDRLVNFAQDQVGQTFFQTMRTNLGLNSFVGGVISATADNGTSQSMVVPEAMETLTFSDLSTLKTPWGRQYLGMAQDYGAGPWGIS